MTQLRESPLAHQGLAHWTATTAERGKVRLLPDPAPRPVWSPVISVDDHLVEPADLFEGRLSAKYADAAPKVIETEGGRQMWSFEGRVYSNTGLSAVVGRPPEDWNVGDPARFDEMRSGCWSVHDRVKDMDIDGIWASICFPSSMAGFSGRIFSLAKDAQLGAECLRAYNDWHLEAWVAEYPQRFIPLQLPWLPDPVQAAQDVRRNAERGFRALSFPDRPDLLGFPSVQSREWDPLLQACEETGTVLCLHAGSSGWQPVTRPDAPLELLSTLFTVSAAVAAAEWVWSGVPVRFPELKIAMSEGGISWVPMLYDRFEYIQSHSGQSIIAGNSWHGDISPSEALLRSFWFCSLDDPTVMKLRHDIGVDHIMLEVDYPHSDSTWPNTQALLQLRYSHLPPEEVAMMSYGNASKLFRHPEPPADFAASRRVSA